VYLKKIYNRFFAFIYGWSLFTVIESATISSLAYIFAQSLNSILPIPDILPSLHDVTIGGIFFPFQDFGVKLTAILLILILTALNISGLKSGAWVSKAILTMVFIGLLLIVGFGLTSHVAKPADFMNFSDLSNGTVTFSSFFTAMLAAFWAYQGWVSVGFIGGEVKDANRNLPKGIVAGVFVVIVIYLLVNVTYLALLSIPQLEQVHAAGNQIAAIEAVRSFWGAGGVLFISLLILLTTLGCTNATILTGAGHIMRWQTIACFFPRLAKSTKPMCRAFALLAGDLGFCSGFVGHVRPADRHDYFCRVYFLRGHNAGVFILRRKMPDVHRRTKYGDIRLFRPSILFFVWFCFSTPS
jgi:APA family basic amino acid/polyamine antiporter